MNDYEDEPPKPKFGGQYVRPPIIKCTTDEDRLRLAIWFIQRFDSPEDAEEAVSEAAVALKTMAEKREKKKNNFTPRKPKGDYTSAEIKGVIEKQVADIKKSEAEIKDRDDGRIHYSEDDDTVSPGGKEI